MRPGAHPSERAGLISKLFFCWAWPTLKLGHAMGSSLTSSHLPELAAKHRPAHVAGDLSRLWRAELEAASARGTPPSLVRVIWYFYGSARIVMFAGSIALTVLNISIPLIIQQVGWRAAGPTTRACDAQPIPPSPRS